MAVVATIRSLKRDPQNRRSHPPRNIAMIAEALKRVGFARSVVVDEHNRLLAGDGVVTAAKRAGLRKLQIVDADGSTIIAVRRKGLTAAEKRDLALYDNRTGELAVWNLTQLQRDVAAGRDLSHFFTDEELAALLTGKPATNTGKTDPDSIVAPRRTSIKRGDLFELGAHRLLCGDATSADDVGRLFGDDRPWLMVTDPPYGVDYDPQWRDGRVGTFGAQARAGEGIKGDQQADWRSAYALFPGDVAYVWHASLRTDAAAAALRAVKLEPRAHVIWKKQHFAISRGHYQWIHEPCWYAVRLGATARWKGGRKQTTVWEISSLNPAGRKEDRQAHGTQKPVECMRRPMENHGLNDRPVYDPFLGSGTTLIAAEQTGRRCFAIEIEPRYVQMAIDRWEAFAGQKARKG